MSGKDKGAGDSIQIRVRDSGIGIPREKISQLFRAFQQLDISTNRRFGGTGLGLVISNRLVDAMGGRISVESVEGEGSTFTVTLPVVIPAEPAAPVEASAVQRLEGLRILVAEDNPVNQIVVKRMLSSMGCLVDVVSDGVDAVAKAQEADYDLAIFDMWMPDMDGTEAARQIRTINSPLADLPIVALTASATLADREACLKSGMNDFLTKPVSPAALREALLRWALPTPAETEGAEQARAGMTMQETLISD